MDHNLKYKLLKIFLRISALIQIFYWSASHLFYPRWYLNSVGAKDFDVSGGFGLLLMNEIGILTLGIAFATWLASYDPLKNIAIIFMLYILSIGSILVSLYHILSESFKGSEETTVVVLAVQLAILTCLYPWKEASKKGLLGKR